VGTRQLKNGERRSRFAIEIGAYAVAFGAEFGAPHIRKIDNLAVVPSFDDDLSKLLRCNETPLRIESQLELRTGRRRLGAKTPRCDLDVLCLNCRHNVVTRQTSSIHLVWIQPDPHAVFSRSENIHVAYTFKPRERIANLQERIIADVSLVIGSL